MQEFKCKICGGTLDINRASGIAVCEYCGTKQALPRFTDDESTNLYDSANNYLQQGEFEKAESIFNRLSAANPQDAELYWDMVLCKYGVTFVCDPQTREYIPTCNRTHVESVLKDKNYLKAVELSTGEKQEYYKENANTIDNIQKGIIEISSKEKPFDIFISYKETDAEGNRTKDSIAAQDLYDKLNEAGYKVFFSRITLEDKIGTEYEPYIYSALSSSKVMLTICSSKENIESTWVKNEWSRYIAQSTGDLSKTLIPVYFDMPESDLPDEFALLSPQNMAEADFEQELLRGIKKLIPLPIMLAEKRKKTRKTMRVVSIVAAVVVVVVLAIILPRIISSIRYGQQYNEAQELYEGGEYSEALGIFNEIVDYKDSAEMAERCEKQPQYEVAEQYYYDGDYAQATWAFDELGDYEDSEEMKLTAELSWRKSLANLQAWSSDVYPFCDYFIGTNSEIFTPNGENALSDIGLDTSEHGNVVSIGAATPIYVLHEDGYVTNATENNRLLDDSEWHNIVKISDGTNYYNGGDYIDINYALRSDGTMLYGEFDSENYYVEGLNDLSAWEDIVDFESAYVIDGPDISVVGGLIVGIKSDGDLCFSEYVLASKEYPESYSSYMVDIDPVIFSQFHNVKEVRVSLDPNIPSYAEGGNIESALSIIAITSDNKVATYKNGVYSEQAKGDICKLISTEYAILSNGDLIETETEKVVLHDIIYGGESSNGTTYFVTKSGGIYYEGEIDTDEANDYVITETYTVSSGSDETYEERESYHGFYKLDESTVVWEEWMKRLN